jgi:hypothetical protein
MSKLRLIFHFEEISDAFPFRSSQFWLPVNRSKMRTRIILNTVPAKFIFILFVVLTIWCIAAEAQTPLYRGMEISFGVRTYKVESNFEAINNSTVALEGGRARAIIGNEIVRLGGGIGFFYSASSTAHTFELTEGDVSANFYLFQNIRMSPYLVTGFTFAKNKFYGYYAGDAGQVNWSSAELPRIGTIDQLRASMGAGAEFDISREHDFVHLFTEARYGISLLQRTDAAVLTNTAIGNQLTVRLGVRFGAYRRV